MALSSVEVYGIAQLLNNIFTSFNVLCSITTLYLIYCMKLRINGYILIIIVMTTFQGIYDAQLFLLYNCEATNTPCSKAELFIGSSTGMATGFWTCVLSFMTTFVILTRRPFDARTHFNLMNIIISCLSAAVAIVMTYFYQNTNYSADAFLYAFDVYNYARLAMIVFNGLAYLITVVTLRIMLPDAEMCRCSKYF